MSYDSDRDVAIREKLIAVWDVIQFNPLLTLIIICLGLVAASTQGIGLTFLLPIVEQVQSTGTTEPTSGSLSAFATVYSVLGVPFTLGTIVLGAIAVMTVRYILGFLFGWQQQVLRSNYIRDLQERMLETILVIQSTEYDKLQSDQILNDIITETYYAGRVIQRLTSFLEIGLLTVAYLVIASLISPSMTAVALVFLSVIAFALTVELESGYELGNRVATGNAKRHEAAQNGVQNLREVRFLNSEDYIRRDFQEGIDNYTRSRNRLRRNQNAINYAYELAVAISVLVSLYVGATILEIPISLLTLYLLVMIEIGPNLSSLHVKYYQVQNDLPHLVWVQQFMDRVETEENGSTPTFTEKIRSVTVDNVNFAYNGRPILEGISFAVENGEMVAIIGPSGVGKSTLISLLAGIYKPNQGEILANNCPVHKLAPSDWRDRVSLVQQDPTIFNWSLAANLSVANPNTSNEELERVCEITRVDEFAQELPEKYNTVLGDEGSRLSGGQKQRVALARALLQDTDLILLDEATSKLDKQLESDILSSIKKCSHDTVIIAVAPRIPAENCFDRIHLFHELSGSATVDNAADSKQYNM